MRDIKEGGQRTLSALFWGILATAALQCSSGKASARRSLSFLARLPLVDQLVVLLSELWLEIGDELALGHAAAQA